MNTAYLLAANVNDGSSVQKSWEPPLENTAEATLSAIPEDQALTIGRLANGRVPDVLGTLRGPFVVAPALREFLNAMEPGAHRFLPIQIQTKSATGEKARTKDDSWVWGGGIPYGDDLSCTLDGGPIEGRHLWRVAEGAKSARYACSPEFWNFFKSSKMLGWEIYKTCAVK